ncbi:uncharacterized protein LTR77_008839 [Saxophila tyrrhenica]|uniref:EthD domain-containing protein n=1 Tax=Saxophila tyrrhenica TaxID=1690608 RepID=A0AAV9P2A8_9PEZI|nr:hypothetical protein LTR77_008839 [Saxophila tyrrhenica]
MSVYIYVSYPRKEGATFNMDYYLTTHMKIVDTHWRPYGMKSWSVVEFPPNDPSGMHVQAIMLWDSVEAFEKAIAANIPEVMEDLQYYSSEPPVRWYGNVAKTSGEGI